jgi:hypothetical protein
MKSESEKDKEIVANRFKDMTAGQKLNLSLMLYYSARKLKKAAIEQLYPELTQKQVEDKVRESFLYATGNFIIY